MVSEAKNLALWQQIKRLVNDFLMGLWTSGALFGDTADKAFRVRVDESLNPPSITALGQLIVEVTVRLTGAGGIRGLPSHPGPDRSDPGRSNLVTGEERWQIPTKDFASAWR